MGVLGFIKDKLGNPKDEPVTSAAPAPSAATTNAAPARPEPPRERTVIEAPVLDDEPKGASDGPAHSIRIKAQPARMGDTCKFMADRPVFEGHSWHFPNAAAAEGAPLAEALFATGEVESLTVLDSTMTVTRKDRLGFEWEPFAKTVGAILREHLEKGRPAVAPRILEGMPSTDEIRTQLQQVLDVEINPAVAGHDGHVSLVDVKGNTAYVKMGGGCQGCSSASATLRYGIENTFREKVPFVGAILDETDHAAGTNPYFR